MNLRVHNRTGPSSCAIAVLRALLKAPAPVPALAHQTRLAERTVRAQIEALKRSDAVRATGRHGYFVIYSPVVHLP